MDWDQLWRSFIRPTPENDAVLRIGGALSQMSSRLSPWPAGDYVDLRASPVGYAGRVHGAPPSPTARCHRQEELSAPNVEPNVEVAEVTFSTWVGTIQFDPRLADVDLDAARVNALIDRCADREYLDGLVYFDRVPIQPRPYGDGSDGTWTNRSTTTENPYLPYVRGRWEAASLQLEYHRWRNRHGLNPTVLQSERFIRMQEAAIEACQGAHFIPFGDLPGEN